MPTSSKPTCPTHGGELKAVPPGISKSGNAYDGFYGCSVRECSHTESMPEELSNKMKEDVRRAKLEKELIQGRSIAHSGSMNNAVAIQTAKIQAGVQEEVDWDKVEEDYKHMYERWEKFFEEEQIKEL